MEHTSKLLTIDEARAVLRIGKNTMYSLVQQGLPSVRIGKQIRIPLNLMFKWLEDLAKNQSIEKPEPTRNK